MDPWNKVVLNHLSYFKSFELWPLFLSFVVTYFKGTPFLGGPISFNGDNNITNLLETLRMKSYGCFFVFFWFVCFLFKNLNLLLLTVMFMKWHCSLPFPPGSPSLPSSSPSPAHPHDFHHSSSVLICTPHLLPCNWPLLCVWYLKGQEKNNERNVRVSFLCLIAATRAGFLPSPWI